MVEDIKKGQLITGWVMDTDQTIRVEAREQVPLGNEVALQDMKKDDTVTNYGHDFGRVVAAVEKGGHVHVHGVETERW